MRQAVPQGATRCCDRLVTSLCDLPAMTVTEADVSNAVPPAMFAESAEFEQALDRMLVESGAVDRRSLDRARRVASEGGARLDAVLTQLGLITERGLAEV